MRTAGYAAFTGIDCAKLVARSATLRQPTSLAETPLRHGRLLRHDGYARRCDVVIHADPCQPPDSWEVLFPLRYRQVDALVVDEAGKAVPAPERAVHRPRSRARRDSHVHSAQTHASSEAVSGVKTERPVAILLAHDIESGASATDGVAVLYADQSAEVGAADDVLKA